MRTRTLAALTLCLLAASAAVGALAATPAASPGQGVAGSGVAATEPGDGALHAPSIDSAAPQSDGDPVPYGASTQWDPDVGYERTTTIEFRVQADGDARVVVSTEYSLDSEAEEDVFQQLRQEFEDGELDLGAVYIRRVVDDVSNHTSRSMTATDVERSSGVDGDTGRLEERFTWRNFGNATEDTVVVGDAFYDENGQWLRSLQSDQRLVLRSPQGYGIEDSSAGVAGDAVVWEAQEDDEGYVFDEDEFRTVFVRDGSVFDLESSTLLAVGLGLILVGVVAFLLLRRYGLAWMEPEDASAADVGGSGELGTSDAGQPTDRAAQTTGAGALAPEEATGDAGEEDAMDGVDPELLSDEERVERLLERNGGRMKQANIVDETGWSNAKVSQLLSEMAENDRVDKLRIGRENLITLPDEDVTATE